MARALKLFPIWVVSALALLLLGLSIPSMIAALISLPYDRDLERIRSGKPPSPPAIIQAAQANVNASRFFESARYRTNAATALLALNPAEQKASGLDAEALVRQALSTAPASAYNWNRLAYFRIARGDRKAAEKAWQMSVMTGRYEPKLMNGRIAMAISMFPISDPAMIGMLIDQVKMAAQADSRGLAKASIDAGGSPFVRAVLWDDPVLVGTFDASYVPMMRMKGWKARGK